MRTIILVFLALGLANCLFSQASSMQDSLRKSPYGSYFELYGDQNHAEGPLVVVFPDLPGSPDWYEDFAKKLAKEGSQVILFNPFASQPNSRGAGMKLDGNTYAKGLAMVFFEKLKKDLPQRKVILIGFGAGVQQTFELMTHFTNIEKSFIVGGFPNNIKAAQYSMIQCKIYGFFGRQDEEEARKLSFMKKYIYGNGKNFEVNIYHELEPDFLSQMTASNKILVDSMKHTLLKSVRNDLPENP